MLGTPNEEVWPGVGKLLNWYEYHQFNVSKLFSVIPSLDANGIDLLEISHPSCAFVVLYNLGPCMPGVGKYDLKHKRRGPLFRMLS
jgi:hypothetical protein